MSIELGCVEECLRMLLVVIEVLDFNLTTIFGNSDNHHAGVGFISMFFFHGISISSHLHHVLVVDGIRCLYITHEGTSPNLTCEVADPGIVKLARVHDTLTHGELYVILFDPR